MQITGEGGVRYDSIDSYNRNPKNSMKGHKQEHENRHQQ